MTQQYLAGELSVKVAHGEVPRQLTEAEEAEIKAFGAE
jgi:hypothetical protein